MPDSLPSLPEFVPTLVMLLLSIVCIVVGVSIVGITLLSAIRTFVVPRSAPDTITRTHFRTIRRLFRQLEKRLDSFDEVDSLLALYAPVTLVALPFVWLFFIMVGYAFIYWGLNLHPATVNQASLEAFAYAIRASSSTLVTLGFVGFDGLGHTLIAFSEAIIGPVMIALLIAYLPTLYSSFSARESLVAMLEVRSGSPPMPTELFRRVFRFAGTEELHKLWQDWERWFTELEETHTSLPSLAFFRSQQSTRSWITAAGLMLDCAALQLSVLDLPDNGYAPLTLRAGFLALQRIATFFGIPFDPHPTQGDPISISRAEFDQMYNDLVALELFQIKPDREQAWINYAGWRVNYDTVLIKLAQLVTAPYAPWSSDRGIRGGRPTLFPTMPAADATPERQDAAT